MATLIEAFGIAYGAGDIKVRLLERTVDGIEKIMYNTAQEKTNLYGMGREPVQRGRGNKTYEGSITLKAFEMDAIQATVPSKDITDIKPFTIDVNYFDADEARIKTDRLLFCEFTNDNREINGGDQEVKTECTLVIGKIQRDV